jgi:hypothetical protein
VVFVLVYGMILLSVQIFYKCLYIFLSVRKENEEMVNAISREEGNEHNNTAKGFTVGSSPMPLSL